METHFTPGQWYAKGIHIKIKDIPAPIGQSFMCNVPTYGPSKDFIDLEAEANAKLMAAAPDLLYALQNLMNDIGGSTTECGHNYSCTCAFEKAKAAIEKAIK